ncbi:MAG TPA: RloB family protein [Leptospiraceae bacterium]|nr:RloB family protein [Leptospiraceae bacterium]HMW06590.1 RloB family protein [Leptospiraceae bacterium]HMX34980.1 RloB family protein [Leptospiraceae bacterium]HMY31219.1 RloB family protein [Leptospiraceae bacterium]HMZ63294.1 RloB family protein [Leptospiraceae bacterium]
MNNKILILVEGENTEVHYFQSFKKIEKYRRNLVGLDIEIYKPKDHSPKGLLKEAKKKIDDLKRIKLKYEKIWIVLDRDGHFGVSETFEETRVWNQNKKNTKIEIAFSNICFERWILLHFEKSARPFMSCDEIVSYIHANHDSEYNKKIHYDFTELIEETKLKVAIENAKWLERQKEDDLENMQLYDINPYTTVHYLAEYIFAVATRKSTL